VSEKAIYSAKLLKNAEAKNPLALERITLAKKRIQQILDTQTVAHQKTLEQKISAQGPTNQRVDPHLVGLAIMDLAELNRLKKVTHRESNTKSWCANIGTSDDKIASRLADLGPLYASINGGDFGNLTGDALEIITFKCINGVWEKKSTLCL
jgi:hypothetical protein